MNDYQYAIVYYSLAACIPTLNAIKNKNAHTRFTQTATRFTQTNVTYLTDKQLKEHAFHSERISSYG